MAEKAKESEAQGFSFGALSNTASAGTLSFATGNFVHRLSSGSSLAAGTEIQSPVTCVYYKHCPRYEELVLAWFLGSLLYFFYSGSPFTLSLPAARPGECQLDAL